MKYKQVVTGVFIERPNRFIAYVLVEGRQVVCHVKNTGRCRELLLPGVKVILEYHENALELGRKTEYSLIGVYKEAGGQTILINMDSQAPNQVACEWLTHFGNAALNGNITEIRREVTYAQSRFDLAFVIDGERAFMEVKGVTLEADGIVMFPDAPTQRGVKHLKELGDAVQSGYKGYVLFVIQMAGVRKFKPNMDTHPAFGEALKEAFVRGVQILAYDCLVTKDTLEVRAGVEVDLT